MKARDWSPAFTGITIFSFPEAAWTKQRIHSGKEIHRIQAFRAKAVSTVNVFPKSWYVSLHIGFSFMSEGAKMMA
jgi:hypothetical protein